MTFLDFIAAHPFAVALGAVLAMASAAIVERTLKLRILDAEVVTGPHAEQADQARQDARAQRETAGTLLEGAFK